MGRSRGGVAKIKRERGEGREKGGEGGRDKRVVA